MSGEWEDIGSNPVCGNFFLPNVKIYFLVAVQAQVGRQKWMKGHCPALYLEKSVRSKNVISEPLENLKKKELQKNVAVTARDIVKLDNKLIEADINSAYLETCSDNSKKICRFRKFLRSMCCIPSKIEVNYSVIINL